jgi:hypothetical protein
MRLEAYLSCAEWAGDWNCRITLGLRPWFLTVVSCRPAVTFGPDEQEEASGFHLLKGYITGGRSDDMIQPLQVLVENLLLPPLSFSQPGGSTCWSLSSGLESYIGLQSFELLEFCRG